MANKNRVKLASGGENYKAVQTYTSRDENASLAFTFAQFHLKPIDIKGEFNNHFKDSEQFIDKISVLLDKALPLLSKENASIFSGEHGKADALHLHPIDEKEEIIEKILREYGFAQQAIEDILEGFGTLYQLEVPYINGSTRIVFQRIDNLVSFLFIDPNHHIYMNKALTKQAGFLFYEYCPVNEGQTCYRMNYLNTCFAFEFLDRDKLAEAYGYDWESNGGGAEDEP